MDDHAAGGTSPGRGLPDILRQIRQEAGESLKQAGPKLGVTYSYLSKIENGVVMPSSELLERMAHLYGAEQDVLFAAARRLPPDVVQILEEHLVEAIALLRRSFPRDSRDL